MFIDGRHTANRPTPEGRYRDVPMGIKDRACYSTTRRQCLARTVITN